ncbi:MAG TPA: Crp/Fnr family transcriptional regulator [Caproicibacter sp.]|nr:Crp/Fnr family transcriptional regulator [Caproicibacter sp.]
MPINEREQEFLKQVLPFWGELTAEQQRAVKNGSASRHFSPGSVLHSGPGDCAGLFVIIKGQVRAYILSDSGREITLYRLFDRDVCIFSASCMMKDIRFDVHMQAVEETETILIPTPVYRELDQNSLAVSNYTSQILSSRFSDVMWLLEQILFMSLDKRLALHLIELSSISGNRLKVTHEEIARDIGTAREVVTRMLKYFQTEGMVKLSRGEINLTDRKKLESLAK